MAAFENPERVTSFADQNPRREVVTMRTYDYVQADARSLDSQAFGTFDGGVKGVSVQGA